jgi:hypothetical protein
MGSSEAIEALTDLRDLYIRAFYRRPAVASDLDSDEAEAEMVRQGQEWFNRRDALQHAQERLIATGFDLPVSWSVELFTTGNPQPMGEGRYEVKSYTPDRDAIRQVLREMDTAILKLQNGRTPDSTDNGPPDELLSELTKTERLLLEYLWGHPTSRLAKVVAKVWPNGVDDPSAIRTAQRLCTKLADLGHGAITIETKGGYIKLVRPPDK